MKEESPISIVVTGPESTGKTDLSKYLADAFRGTFVPEYAREYIENLRRSYNYNDILKIARYQVLQQEHAVHNSEGFIFYDTWLIITKIWLMEVYGKYPDWIDYKLKKVKMDLYLLCAPDIPWIPDPVRENGGERRDYLFLQYKSEIERLGVPYYTITGTGTERNEKAEKMIVKHFRVT